MSSITLRTTDDEKELILMVAEMEGLSVSSYIKKTVLEKIEDDYDTKIGLEALEEYQQDPVSYTLEEIKKIYGL